MAKTHITNGKRVAGSIFAKPARGYTGHVTPQNAVFLAADEANAAFGNLMPSVDSDASPAILERSETAQDRPRCEMCRFWSFRYTLGIGELRNKNGLGTRYGRCDCFPAEVAIDTKDNLLMVADHFGCIFHESDEG